MLVRTNYLGQWSCYIALGIIQRALPVCEPDAVAICWCILPVPCEVPLSGGVRRVEAMLLSALLVHVLLVRPPGGNPDLARTPVFRAIGRLRFAFGALGFPGAGLGEEDEGLVLRVAGDATHKLPHVDGVAAVVPLFPAKDERKE